MEKTDMKTIGNRWMSWAPMLAISGVLAIAGLTTALKPKDTAARVEVDEKPIARSGPFTTSFAPVVKKVSPSVVKVVTSTAIKPNRFPEGLEAYAPWLRQFFDEQSGRPSPHVPREHGVGSGVIVSRDGYLLTNNHVVDGANEVKVTLQDGREFTAKVVGTDPKTDVAVIKIEAQDLPSIEIADSDKIEVGDLVLAVGNPFGIGQTVTMGMVSAKGRGNMGLDYEDFIQTDAAINPGNSGGALVDVEGRLIGINTAMLSRNGGNQGIGFAIPTNLARYVMDNLVKDGRVTRGYLGVLIQDITPALAKEFKLKGTQGVLIGDVTAGSPADQAGLKSGDVVLAFNNKPATDSRQLKLAVAQTQPGKTVPIQVAREGSTKTIEVAIKELPGKDRLAKSGTPDRSDTGTLNGVGVSDLNNEIRRQMDMPAGVWGAVVTEVDPDSAAYEAGLKPGDIIQEINREPVKNAAEAVRLTENPKDKTTLLKVWRQGSSRYVVVDENKAG